MGRNITARPGRYRVATAPYQKEWQESFTARDVQVTVLYVAKRLGKTESINNLHGSQMEQSPRNILHVMPTLDSAKKWSKQFLMPMVKSTPALRNLIKDSRQKDANNTILSKEFPGGAISAIGANSPSGFRQVQAPVVTCDEVDAMENGPEGDPVTLAFGRAENYPDSIQVVSSTATRLAVKPKDGQMPEGGTGSRIHDWWLKSDQRKWFVPCGCGKWHVLMWSGVKWPDGHKHEEAYYETPCCGAKWDDYQRVAAILAGEWRPTAPFRGIRGYWLNGLNTTFPPKKGYKTKLHQMAAEFYDAYTSGEAARITWKNTFLCEPHEEVAERVDPTPLMERREAYDGQALPDDVALLGAVVDVQGDRLEVDVIGLGNNEETWAVEFRKILGDPEKEAVWKDLRDFLGGAKYSTAAGVSLGITATAIDLGYKPHRVRRFIKGCGLPRVYGLAGASGLKKQVNLVVPHQNKHYRMWNYTVNTILGKDTVFARLRLKEAGPRYMHFNFGYDAAYFDGLTAEEARVKYTHGFPDRYYVKVRERNEPLDLRVYWLALIDILKPNIAAVRASTPKSKPKDYELKPEPPEAEPIDPVVAMRRPVPIRPARKNWVNGWR